MTEQLGTSLVKVGDRRREDYGDIDALATSIAQHGLLHPIVVDADDNLVAGGRRLRAVEQLGWISIPVTRLGDLTETQLREIELEENLRRKDLTAIEVSRNLVELAEVAAEADRASVQSLDSREQPGSLRRISERIGVPKSTIAVAREHVAAVDEYPELEPLPQAEAIRTARTLRVPVSEELLEQQQRDTSIRVIADAVRTLEADPSHAEAVIDRLIRVGGDTGPLVPSRFDRVIDYAAAFAAELRKRGIDG